LLDPGDVRSSAGLKTQQEALSAAPGLKMSGYKTLVPLHKHASVYSLMGFKYYEENLSFSNGVNHEKLTA
jgi:hypothetical protein